MSVNYNYPPGHGFYEYWNDREEDDNECSSVRYSEDGPYENKDED